MERRLDTRAANIRATIFTVGDMREVNDKQKMI
jgi:hypothetical protein